MGISDAADQYFTYESRVASFQTSTKRRASNASSKASKALKWPHKFLSGEELAKAGFFYYPVQSNPDNVACFLCHSSLDGWEEGDDPFVEHLKHSPACGWAIVATIERDDGVLSQEYPCSSGMIEARKATFANKWPHEGKKGWKCKIKQMVDSGWKFTPTPESDDMATCTYCGLSLDGWEPSDKPLDEHFKRSRECPFFTLINDHKQDSAVSRTKSKRGRTSKAARLSTQSSFTVASDAPALGDLAAEEGDSVLTAATNVTATTQASQKMGRKKAVPAKGKKTRAKRNEAVEIEQPAPEPEDDDFSVKVDLTPKASRGKKRKSEQIEDSEQPTTRFLEAPPAKRRTTRTGGSMAVDDSALGSAGQSAAPEVISGPTGRKARTLSRSTRKVSTAASVASLRARIPDDDELDRALQADLDTQMTDDESIAAVLVPLKKSSRAKPTQEDHAMFASAPMDIDEAAIDAEMEALEAESKRLPKAKGAKAKQPRKVSAKQQATAKKLAEAEAEAERLAADEASKQIEAELENSLSVQHSSPVIQSKRQRATSRQPLQQSPGRKIRESAMPANGNDVFATSDVNVTVHMDHDDSGAETDVSLASQSTIVRGAGRRGSTLKKGQGDKKAANRNIEEIVHKTADVPEEMVPHSDAGQSIAPAKESKIAKSAKPKGRPAKASATVQERVSIIESIEAEPAARPNSKAVKGKAVTQTPGLMSPPPREVTPTLSPQSSDAENHPPSSKPSLTSKKPSTPHTTTTRIPLAATPMLSPSKRNVIAGLQSTHSWTAVDIDTIFLKSPTDKNQMGLFGDAVDKVKVGGLSSPEKKMTVEEWIQHNAQAAEERLRNECERMVGIFESEGTRAMRALEGVECIE